MFEYISNFYLITLASSGYFLTYIAGPVAKIKAYSFVCDFLWSAFEETASRDLLSGKLLWG